MDTHSVRPHRPRAATLVLAVAVGVLPACTDAGGQDDDSFDPIDETGETDDDSTPAPDDDTTPPPDDDTTPPPDDDTTPPGDPLGAIAVLPSDIPVDPGTTFALLVRGTTEGGRVLELAGDSYVSSDPAVAAVTADGRVEAMDLGAATITVAAEGFEAEATVRVVDPGALAVEVVDADTGLPIPGATVLIGASAAPVATSQTDSAGVASLSGDFSGRVVVTAVADGYVRASMAGAASREQRIPMRPLGGDPSTWPAVTGTFGWPGDMGAAGMLGLGVVGAAYAGNPVLYDLGGLLGPTRSVTVYGFPVELPGNLVVKYAVEDFEVPAAPGEAALWSLAGELSLDEAIDIAAADPEDQLPLVLLTLSAILPEMAWGLAEGVEVDPEAGAELDVAPATSISEAIDVTVPPNPVGTFPEDLPIVLALADTGTPGWALCGLATGSGGTVLRRVSDSDLPPGAAVEYVAVVEVGGVGSGGDASAVRGAPDPVFGGVVFPDFLEIPGLTPPTAVADWTWTFTRITGADVGVNRLDGRLGSWDVYAPGDAASFQLADVEPRLGLDQVFWTLQPIEVVGTAFEALAGRADGGMERARADADRQSRSWVHYAASP